MPNLFFTLGLPRGGKTTLRNYFKNKCVIVSADDLRYIIYGERYNQNRENEVWEHRKYLLNYLMSQGKDIFIDETNTTKKRRESLIMMAKEYNYIITCFYINTSESVCIKRAEVENDQYIIPIIKRMAEQLETPIIEEGIDRILSIDGLKVKEEIESLINPNIENK